MDNASDNCQLLKDFHRDSVLFNIYIIPNLHNPGNNVSNFYHFYCADEETGSGMLISDLPSHTLLKSKARICFQECLAQSHSMFTW